MKKGKKLCIAGICAVLFLSGCGSETISNDKITIKKYKGLEVEKAEFKISDDELEAAIQTDLQTLELDVEEDTAQMGHIVYVNYVGKKDGVPFEGGSADYARLVLGESEPFEGMSEGIVGHVVDESFELPLTLPADFGPEELNGKSVVFTITVKEIKKLCDSDQVTEELLPYLSATAKTIDEYRKDVRKNMEENNAESAKTLLEQQLWKALLENCEVKEYPEDKVKEEAELLKSQYTLEAMMMGTSLEEYMASSNKNPEATAKAKIAQAYAVELIAEKEGITVSDKFYVEKLQEYAMREGYPDTKQYEEDCGKDKIIHVIKQEKVVEILMDTCVQIEPKEVEK